MKEVKNAITFSSQEVADLLGISRVTVSRRARLLGQDLKREKFTLEVFRYRWSKKHIATLIESLKGKIKKEQLRTLAKEKGLI